MSRPVILLGSEPSRETLEATLGTVAPEGPVATIRAGWQEMETEPSLLTDVLGDRAVPLELHGRAERVWDEDPDLMAAHRAMQGDARLLRRAYNVRLSATMDAWDELSGLEGSDDLLAPERAAMLAAVRELDEHQLRRMAELRSGFTDDTALAARPAVARERAEISGLLDGVAAIVVDGGHVAVLLNRIRLFGVEALLVGRSVVGISGGAMVLTERLVLFHDSPPWGPGHAEVAEFGLGRAPGIVALPRAARRLRLDDPVRVGRFALRFAPAECLALDGGSRLDFSGSSWSGPGARHLTGRGDVVDRDAAA